MILKARASTATIGGNESSWLLLDGVRKSQTFERIADGRTFSSQRELEAVVEEMYGPFQVRPFTEEFWPEFGGDRGERQVTAVRLDMLDGSWVLALLDDDAFMLSDKGDTIERLR